jgi:hypothetical protein
MGNKFCKYKDTDNQTYVVIDKNKQPLACEKNSNKCHIGNYQKVIDSPAVYNDVSQSTVFETTNIPCAYNDNGLIANLSSIDTSIYKFATYDSTNGPKQSGDSSLTSENVYYGLYAGVTQNSVLNRDELKRRHDISKLLFNEVQLKSLPAQATPTAAPTASPSQISINLREVDDDYYDSDHEEETHDTSKIAYVAIVIGLLLFLLLVFLMAFSS